MFKHEKVHLLIFVVLIGLQVLGVIGLLHRFQLSYLPVMLVVFFWGGISTTLYLHRYLTHRGFEMPEWLKFFFATGSAVTLAGDPVMWVGDHRYHHLKSDTDEDIHSPVHGFPYAHMMWLVRKPPGFRERSKRYAADVRKIWYCRLWENSALYVLPHLLVATALFFTFGFAGMLWCLYVPMLLIYNVTWAVNSICHMPRFGYRSFRHVRSQPKQLFDRRPWIWRGLSQQSSRPAALRRPRIALVGIRHHALRHLAAGEMRTRLGRGLARGGAEDFRSVHG